MSDRSLEVFAVPFLFIVAATVFIIFSSVPAECQQQQDAESSPQVELRCYICDNLCSDTVGQYEVSVTETIPMIDSDGYFEPCVACYTRMFVSGKLERGCLTQSDIDGEVFPAVSGSGCTSLPHSGDTDSVCLCQDSFCNNHRAIDLVVITDNTTLTSRCSSSGVTLTSSISGYIVSPGWPKQYGNNEDCVWIIQPDGATEYTRIRIDIIEFKTEPNYDKLVIYDGPSSTYGVKASINGSNIHSPEYISSGSTISLAFTSDASVTFKGFHLTYTTVEDNTTLLTSRCSSSGVTLTSSISGYIVSPGWPEQYGNNEDCVWIIQPDGATEYTRIRIDIIEFKTERTHDKLIIHDGPSSSSSIISSISGSDLDSAEYLSSGSTVSLSFTSDGSATFKGFHLTYTVMTVSVLQTNHFITPVTTTRPTEFTTTTTTPRSDRRPTFEEGLAEYIEIKSTADATLQCRINNLNGDKLVIWLKADSILFVGSVEVTLDARRELVVDTSVEPQRYDLHISNANRDDSGVYTCRINMQPITELHIELRVDGGDASHATCGQSFVHSDNDFSRVRRKRIVNGDNADLGQFPYQANLNQKIANAFITEHMCGASIISDHWVVTAAHCIQPEFTLDDYLVRVGDYRRGFYDPTESSFDVEEILVHPDYHVDTERRYVNDIALLKLKSVDGRGIAFTDYVQPICLPREELLEVPNLTCAVTGWGATTARAVIGQVLLQAAYVHSTSHRVCNEVFYRGDTDIFDTMLCGVSLQNEPSDTCQGDSGGPLACVIDGRYTLIGVTSFGEGCGRSTRPGVYTSVLKFTKWIRDSMKTRQ